MAWDLARCNIAKAQQRQKHVHDRRARDPEFRVGERVFLHFPSIKTGPAYKFARPYRGPYRIVSLHNGAALSDIERPGRPAICVALNRLCWCPDEIPDKSQTVSDVPTPLLNSTDLPDHTDATDHTNSSPNGLDPSVIQTDKQVPKLDSTPDTTHVWRGRLRGTRGRGEDASR